MKIGDFVTSYEAGYWQVLDFKPHIADDDYCGSTAQWKKGDIIGQWVILKKAFTPKMKPRIEFSYVDGAWVKPVSPEVLKEIQDYFADNPDYKRKFDHAAIKLRPAIGNCWINLSENEVEELTSIFDQMPAQFTMDEFWDKAAKFKKNISPLPTSHLINFLAYPWDMDENANLLYFSGEIRTL